MNDAVVFDDAVGVPDRAPVDPFNVTPSGNDPDTTSHVNGPKPPADTRVCEYATDADAGANELVDTTSGSTTRIGNDFVTVRPSASVTRNDVDDNPATVGVPEITPVEEFSVTPAGNDPDATAHVNGARPPDDANVWEYTDPVIPSTNTLDVTAIGAYTSNVNAFDAVRPSMSVTVTVNDDDPTTVGVPDNAPADDNTTPAGNDPAVTAHEYGVTPPAPANDCAYAVPVVPDGNDTVDTDNTADATDNVNAFDAVRPPASVTVTVNDAVVFDTDVGVPDNTPVDAFNDNPAGTPLDTDHVNGPKPPTDTIVCEYATVADAGGNELVVTTNGSTTRTDNTCDA